jgi:hypothetical protein
MQDDIYKDNGNHLSLFCPIVGWMDIELGRADIHEKCPLRDLPSFQVANEYDFETYTNGISIGWNRCLEKVTGEVPDYAKTKGYEGAEIRANKGESGE